MTKILTTAALPSGSAKLLLILFGLWLPATATSVSPPAASNSPYLDLHRSDPVKWRYWGEEVLAEAKKTNKPIFISVGYFTCYWCHVMQGDSFIDAEVAELLNKFFIPVIVDRELNPALDAQLLDFLERYQGSAGWPLNAVLTPEGYPVLGAVYLPRDRFHELLDKLATQWPTQQTTLTEAAKAAARAMAPKGSDSDLSDQQAASLFQLRLVAEAMALADEFNGGFGEQAKFPLSPLLQTLLYMATPEPDGELGRFLQLTLDNMAQGQLRDHLHGGFFRYTSYPDWHEPHFEKMLYDNAQLALIYFQAAEVFSNRNYAAIGSEALDFITGWLSTDEGGLLGALSAVDEHNIEGGYYLWTDAALEKALGKADYAYVREQWPLPGHSPFAHGHLFPPRSTRADPRLNQVPDRLLAARPRDRLPADRKRLAGWNGLALKAFAAGAEATGNRDYLKFAGEIRRYLLQALWDGKTLYRHRPEHGEPIPATLEDYAGVIDGLQAYNIALAQTLGKDHELIRTLTDQAWTLFHDPQGWRPSTGVLLPLPRHQAHMPARHLFSASATLIRSTRTLGLLIKDDSLVRRANKALHQQRGELLNDPFSYPDYGPLLAH